NNLIEEKPKLTSQLVVALREYLTQKKIANAYKITIRTVRNLEKRAKNPNQKKKKRGRKRKIEGYNLSLLKSFVNQNEENITARTQKELVEEYRKKGLELNQSTISRTLKWQEQRNKKAGKRYSELDIEKAKQFVLDNYDLYSSHYCFALDEFGFYSNEVPSYAYSRKGCRAEIIQPGEKGIRYTNIKKKKGEIIKKGTKAVDLHDFLVGINFPNDSHILLDNAKIHHAVKSLIKANRLPIKELAIKKGIILKYLPTRAPMLNPVEFFINNIKNYIKKERPRTEEEVEVIISKVMEKLQKEDLTKNFLHCRDKLNVKSNYKRGK
ncbi:36917_t:CDS:2, partial [Racocetra persica]